MTSVPNWATMDQEEREGWVDEAAFPSLLVDLLSQARASWMYWDKQRPAEVIDELLDGDRDQISSRSYKTAVQTFCEWQNKGVDDAWENQQSIARHLIRQMGQTLKEAAARQVPVEDLPWSEWSCLDGILDRQLGALLVEVVSQADPDRAEVLLEQFTPQQPSLTQGWTWWEAWRSSHTPALFWLDKIAHAPKEPCPPSFVYQEWLVVHAFYTRSGWNDLYARTPMEPDDRLLRKFHRNLSCRDKLTPDEMANLAVRVLDKLGWMPWMQSWGKDLFKGLLTPDQKRNGLAEAFDRHSEAWMLNQVIPASPTQAAPRVRL